VWRDWRDKIPDVTRIVQVNVDALYERHERLLRVEHQVEDLLSEGTPAERELAARLQIILHEILDQIEDVLDSDQSRAVMEDVQQHGSVPWKDVKAELGL
jgi:predicted transcriptional regulator